MIVFFSSTFPFEILVLAVLLRLEFQSMFRKCPSLSPSLAYCSVLLSIEELSYVKVASPHIRTIFPKSSPFYPFSPCSLPLCVFIVVPSGEPIFVVVVLDLNSVFLTRYNSDYPSPPGVPLISFFAVPIPPRF